MRRVSTRVDIQEEVNRGWVARDGAESGATVVRNFAAKCPGAAVVLQWHCTGTARYPHCTGALLPPNPYDIGTGLARVVHWGCTGIALIMYRSCTSTGFVPVWRCTHFELAPPFSCTCTVLVLNWHCTGSVRVLHGQCAVLHCCCTAALHWRNPLPLLYCTTHCYCTSNTAIALLRGNEPSTPPIGATPTRAARSARAQSCASASPTPRARALSTALRRGARGGAPRGPQRRRPKVRRCCVGH